MDIIKEVEEEAAAEIEEAETLAEDIEEKEIRAEIEMDTAVVVVVEAAAADTIETVASEEEEKDHLISSQLFLGSTFSLTFLDCIISWFEYYKRGTHLFLRHVIAVPRHTHICVSLSLGPNEPRFPEIKQPDSIFPKI